MIMARKPNRLSAGMIKADRETLAGLISLGNFNPADRSLSIEALQALERDMLNWQQQKLRVEMEAKAVRDGVLTSEHTFHSALVTARHQAIAQYGSDSPSLHVVGVKRKSEWRRRNRQAVPPE
jgi:hypothetical protein